MRAVTAATAAEILRLDRKAFDNLLLRIGHQALPPGRQGMQRRIPVVLVEELMLVCELSDGLGMGAREAFGIARRLLGRTLEDGQPDLAAAFVGSLMVGDLIQVGVDITALRQQMQTRLELAIETVVRRPRGRPPKSGSPREPTLD